MTFEEAKKCIENYLEHNMPIEPGREIMKRTRKSNAGVRIEQEGKEVSGALVFSWTSKKHDINEDFLGGILGGRKIQIRYTGEKSEELVRLAETNPVAHDAARELAGEIISRGEDLPDPLKKFAARVLLNPESKPSVKRCKDDNWHRDLCIAGAVCFLEYLGYKPITRNRATEKHSSACDVVAEALADHGENITYDAVYKIYSKRQMIRP